MKNESLYQLFIDELADMYSAEHQIIESLPKLIAAASDADLKKGLKDHLEETRHQAIRIESIYSILGLKAKEKKCKAMEGLLKEADDIIKGKGKSSTTDAGIISAAQKVEHYEIASYGTLRSFAKHLNLDSEVASLIQETLDEEGGANKKLTKIAEGSMFSDGINTEAAEGRSSKSHK